MYFFSRKVSFCVLRKIKNYTADACRAFFLELIMFSFAVVRWRRGRDNLTTLNYGTD